LPFQLQCFDGVQIDVNMLVVAMSENRFGHGKADGFGAKRLMGFPEFLQSFDFTGVQSFRRLSQRGDDLVNEDGGGEGRLWCSRALRDAH